MTAFILRRLAQALVVMGVDTVFCIWVLLKCWLIKTAPLRPLQQLRCVCCCN